MLAAAGTLQRHEPQDLTACTRLVDLGRDDFFVSDSLLGQRAVHRSRLSIERFSESREVVGSNTLHFLAPRNRPDAQQLTDEFDKSLRLLQESGEYARILGAHRRHALSAE